MGIFHALAKHGADGILVRNLAGLRFFRERGIRTVADFSLNCANELTASYLSEQGPSESRRRTISTASSCWTWSPPCRPAWLEVVVHQHMPMFHMEHCVFCAVLSPGTNKTNCGRPCDTHQVKLRDRLGMEHPLHGRRRLPQHAVQRGAAKCRGGRAATARARACGSFRVELLDARGTGPAQRARPLPAAPGGGGHRQRSLEQTQASNRVGVTRGTLEERRNPLAIL